MGRTQYNTCAKAMLHELFRNSPDRQFSIEQVIDELKELVSDGKMPGKSTVYRIVGRLYEDGVISRFNDSEIGIVYQYMGEECDCDSHFHLKCTECGKVYHLECGHSEELLCHVLENHHFRIDSGKSLLYGECSECAAKTKTKRKETK